HASRAIRHHRHRLARLRAGDAALRTVPHDLLRGRQGAVALRAQRHDDHACPDAAGAGGDHHLAANSAVPAAPDLAGILALILLTRAPKAADAFERPPLGGNAAKARRAKAAMRAQFRAQAPAEWSLPGGVPS